MYPLSERSSENHFQTTFLHQPGLFRTAAEQAFEPQYDIIPHPSEPAAFFNGMECDDVFLGNDFAVFDDFKFAQALTFSYRGDNGLNGF